MDDGSWLTTDKNRKQRTNDQFLCILFSKNVGKKNSKCIYVCISIF